MKFFAVTKNAKSELYLYDAIGKDFFGDGITAQTVMEELKKCSGSQLDIYVNSPGGSVFEGLAIYNQLKRWKGKKVVHIDGIAASIASVVAMAGDEINIASNGMMMIHQAWGGTVGNADEMRKFADSLEKIDATLLDTYVARTGGNKKQIQEWMTAETWMTADEAVSRKFATKKTADKAIEASFPMLDKFQNVPESLRKQALSYDSKLAHMQMRANKMSYRASPART